MFRRRAKRSAFCDLALHFGVREKFSARKIFFRAKRFVFCDLAPCFGVRKKFSARKIFFRAKRFAFCDLAPCFGVRKKFSVRKIFFSAKRFCVLRHNPSEFASQTHLPLRTSFACEQVKLVKSSLCELPQGRQLLRLPCAKGAVSVAD